MCPTSLQKRKFQKTFFLPNFCDQILFCQFFFDQTFFNKFFLPELKKHNKKYFKWNFYHTFFELKISVEQKNVYKCSYPECFLTKFYLTNNFVWRTFFWPKSRDQTFWLHFWNIMYVIWWGRGGWERNLFWIKKNVDIFWWWSKS